MNYETIKHYVSDMKKTKWKVNTKKTITWKEGTGCNINDTGIFEDPALLFHSKIISSQKTSFQTYGFQPPIHQINSNIYKDNFFPRRSITE